MTLVPAYDDDLQIDELSPAITSVHEALSGLGREPVKWFPDKPVKPKPAVPNR